MISFDSLGKYVKLALTDDADLFVEVFGDKETLEELRRLTCNRFWGMVYRADVESNK